MTVRSILFMLLVLEPSAGWTGTGTGAAPAGPLKPFVLVAIGDVMLGWHYDEAFKAGADPFRNLAPVLRGADMAVANLEGPLTARGRAVAGKRFIFRVPVERARRLPLAGISVVGLANNHIMDYGAIGLADTVAALQGAGVAFCGAGVNEAAARRPAYVSPKGTRVAVLAYNWTWPASFQATARKPGTAAANPAWVTRDVRRARAECPVVVVLFHWGQEKSHSLRDYQRGFSRAAVEAGASLVIGAHPHVAQGVERIGNAVVAHSIGDAVFGGARRRDEDSLILRAAFAETGLARVEFLALETSNLGTDYAPRIRTGADARKVLNLVRKLSKDLGCALAEGKTAEGWPCLVLDLPAP